MKVCTQCVVHVGVNRHPLQPCDQETIWRIGGERQGQEGGADSLHAQVANHLERDERDQEPFHIPLCLVV